MTASMSPELFKDTVTAMNSNPHEMAELLGVTTDSIYAWLAGRRTIPGPVSNMLHFMVTRGLRPKDVIEANAQYTPWREPASLPDEVDTEMMVLIRFGDNVFRTMATYGVSQGVEYWAVPNKHPVTYYSRDAIVGWHPIGELPTK